MPDSRFRFFILRALGVVMLLAVIVKLFDLQIVNGDTYLKRASSRLTTSVVNKAARGDIMDRYGNVLVTNKTGYCVVLRKSTGGDEEFNNIISKVVEILYTTGNKAIDNLPISAEAPYEFIFEDENGDGSTADERAEWFAENKYAGKYIYEGMTADQVAAAYADIFGIAYDVNLAHTRCMSTLR